MKKNDIASILQLIEDAEYTRGEALSPENRGELGYPYLAGYQTSTLRYIKEILERAN